MILENTSTTEYSTCPIPTSTTCAATLAHRGVLENGVEVSGRIGICVAIEFWLMEVGSNAIEMNIRLEKTSNLECSNYYVRLRIFMDGVFQDQILTYSNESLLLQNPSMGEWKFTISGIDSTYNLNVQVSYSTPTSSSMLSSISSTTQNSTSTPTTSSILSSISSTTPNSTNTPTTSSTTEPVSELMRILIVAISVGSLIVIIVFVTLIVKHNKSKS